MERRSFLAMTAGTLAGSLQRRPIGIGFLGANHSHVEGKLEVLRASSEWRIVGACVSEPKAREVLRKQGIALLGREELLRHPELKVIAVESPVRDHARDGLAVPRPPPIASALPDNNSYL